MRARYLLLTLTVETSIADAAAGLLHGLRAGGLIEEGGEDGRTILKAYLPATPAGRRRVAQLVQRIGGLGTGVRAEPPGLAVEEVEDQAWAEAWKRHFRPIRIGRFIIAPSWERVRLRAGTIVIRLDPGMAFGTGLHASTRLALSLLQEAMRPGLSVIDLGTGSGILAIAAAHLGASRVVAVDHDPIAVEAARENVRRNGVAGRVTVVEGEGLTPVDRPVHLIVANLTAGLLEELAGPISRRLRPRGTLVASGIVAARVAGVRKVFAAEGLRVAREEAENEWRAVVAHRAPSAGRGGLAKKFT